MVQVKYYYYIFIILTLTNWTSGVYTIRWPSGFNVFDTPITVTEGDNDAHDNSNIEITPNDVRVALILAQQKFKYIEEHDQSLHDLGIRNDPKGTAFEVLILSGPKKLVDYVNENTYAMKIITTALEYLAKEFCIKDINERKEFYKYVLRKRFRVSGICNVTTIPDDGVRYDEKILKYRTLDGSYNNLKHPHWGQSYDAYPRLLDPDYGDFIDKPRTGFNNEKLPNVRSLRNVVIPSIEIPDSELNNAAMEMTQFISHDLTAQMMDKNLNKGMINCCSKDEKRFLPKWKQHKSCLPIKVSRYDPFYSQYGIECLNFIRSLTKPRSDCLLSWTEQANINTGYLDLSTIYASNTPDLLKIRSFKNGEFFERSPGSNTLPPCETNANRFCYLAGDFRVSTHMMIASLHTIFLRQHNSIARTLHSLNKHWDDERIYQEARRINVAIYQHIIYNELIPIFITPESNSQILNDLDADGFTQCYDENINGAVTNDFAIGFRILHNLVPGKLHMFGKDGRLTGQFQFSDMIRNVSMLETEHGLDDTLRGMTFTNSDTTAPFVTTEITNKIFKMENPQGHDLITLDLARARDHGIPGYSAYRELCGFKPLYSFEDALDFIPYQTVESLKRLYKHPLDVEMYVGNILERPVPGGKVGPVTECLMVKQFRSSACGDRFFYTNKKQKYPFTREQLQEIRKMSFSSVVCENTNIEVMPTKGLLMKSGLNPLVSCKDMPKMDFSYWTEPLAVSK